MSEYGKRVSMLMRAGVPLRPRRVAETPATQSTFSSDEKVPEISKDIEEKNSLSPSDFKPLYSASPFMEDGDGKLRPKFAGFNLTVEEQQLLRSAAKQSKLSLSEFIRRAVFGHIKLVHEQARPIKPEAVSVPDLGLEIRKNKQATSPRIRR